MFSTECVLYNAKFWWALLKVSALVSLLYKAPIGNTFENVCLGREAAVEQAVELLTNS